MNKIEIDGDLYDQFAAEGRLMPGMVRGMNAAERDAAFRRQLAAIKRHEEYQRIHAPKRPKPVKRDKSGLKARLREMQREAAMGKASAKAGL